MHKYEQELPYERFLRFGPESLTETELLAIIIRTGIKDHSAMDLATQVMELGRFAEEGLLGLHRVTIEDLQTIRGIGQVKAVKLKCLTELTLRMSKAAYREKATFYSSTDVAGMYMERLRHKETECVILLCLDTKGGLIREKKMSEGSVKMSLISPREILMEALDAKAVGMILLHNHPSGDPTPSRADIELTTNLREIAEKMDVPLWDHIIIGDMKYTSFRDSDWYTDI